MRESHVSICLNKEKINEDFSVVKVEMANFLLVFCSDCAPTASQVRDILDSLLPKEMGEFTHETPHT